jgi:hypothetical protein
VRAGAAAVTPLLRPELAEFGVAARIQDALQDLLAEQLASITIHTIGVCAKAQAPEQWRNLRYAVFE